MHLVGGFWEYGDESRRCPFGVFGPPARTNVPLAIIMRDQVAGLRVRCRPPDKLFIRFMVLADHLL